MGSIHDFVRSARQLDAGAFRAPWVSHTFEIDCPCPNGEHCGDAHSCEEVDAPEEYPNSPEEPAAGDAEDPGQCIVQISVPGLETFAKANGSLVAFMRNRFGALLDVVDAASDVEAAFKRVDGRGSVYLECSGVEAERRINRLRDALAALASSEVSS